jgi:hypothetical protein
MKTVEKIYLYLEGELTPEEKTSFEKELDNSPELQKELKLYQDFISDVKETKDLQLRSNYFDNVVPEFREKLETKERKLYYPKIAYALPAFIILFLVLFFLFNTQNKKDISNKKVLTSNNINANGLYEIMDYSIDELIPSDLSTSDGVKYNSELDDMIQKELNISSDSTKFLVADKILDYNSIIDNISSKDADIVYDDILNKKF